MRWRFALLAAAFLLPELPLDPFRGVLPPSLLHPLGTDELGRDALLRLVLAGGRSLGFASLTATVALLGALLLAAGRAPGEEGRSALRSVPPLLFLIPLAAAAGGFGWPGLLLLLAALTAIHLEAPLRARLDPFLEGPAWAAQRLLGAGPGHRWRTWLPFFFAQAGALYPWAWLSALWGEATLSALGLGPGPERDSLGRLLMEQLPRLGTDPAPLGWAALALVLALAWVSAPRPREDSWT